MDGDAVRSRFILFMFYTCDLFKHFREFPTL